MAKDDIRRSMDLPWQWEQIGSISLLMDLRKNEETLAQS
jgi:hypothetical protein|tara:strand:- start:61 stop:177 length:117 start_codon:yes stop_codon:yes gene_type:complete